MTEAELQAIEAHMTDGEPYLTLSERTYVADMAVLCQEIRRRAGWGWAAGPVICMVCRHRWTAVRPAGADPLECPRCHQPAGTAEFTSVQQEAS